MRDVLFSCVLICSLLSTFNYKNRPNRARTWSCTLQFEQDLLSHFAAVNQGYLCSSLIWLAICCQSSLSYPQTNAIEHHNQNGQELWSFLGQKVFFTWVFSGSLCTCVYTYWGCLMFWLALLLFLNPHACVHRLEGSRSGGSNAKHAARGRTVHTTWHESRVDRSKLQSCSSRNKAPRRSRMWLGSVRLRLRTTTHPTCFESCVPVTHKLRWRYIEVQVQVPNPADLGKINWN